MEDITVDISIFSVFRPTIFVTILTELFIQDFLKRQILNEIRYDGLEHGGLLAYREGRGICFRCCSGRETPVSYQPDDSIRVIIAHAYNRGMEIGFIHSHPGQGSCSGILSSGDILFARMFLQKNMMFHTVLMGIVKEETLSLYRVTQDEITPVKINCTGGIYHG